MIYAIVLAATLIENVIAVTNAAAQIDAAIVAKGGTTAGGLTNAPAAIAALPTGGGGGWTKPADWPDLYQILSNDTTYAFAKIAVFSYPNIDLPVKNQYATMSGYRNSEGYAPVSGTGDITVHTGTGGWVVFYYSSDFGASSYRGINSYETCYNTFRMVVVEGNLPIQIKSQTNRYFDYGDTTLSLNELSNSGKYFYEFKSNIKTLSGNNLRYCFYLWYNAEDVGVDSITFTGDNAAADSLFSNCFSLKKSPGNINMSACSTASGMFTDCLCLESVPEVLDMSKCTTTANMFNKCYALRKVPEVMCLTNCTNTGNMFNSCYALQNVPTNLTLKAGTSISFASSPLIDTKTIATFNQDDEIIGGMVYNLNPNSGSTITFNAAIKNGFTPSQKSAISEMLTSKGYTLSW